MSLGTRHFTQVSAHWNIAIFTNMLRIMRADWDKPRGDDGRHLLKSDAEMRAQWQREGGFAQNAARVQAIQSAILSASPDAKRIAGGLRDAAFRNLVEVLRAHAAVERLRIGRGAQVEQFLNSLSPSELETFHTWWRGLSRGDRDAILVGISR